MAFVKSVNMAMMTMMANSPAKGLFKLPIIRRFGALVSLCRRVAWGRAIKLILWRSNHQVTTIRRCDRGAVLPPASRYPVLPWFAGIGRHPVRSPQTIVLTGRPPWRCCLIPQRSQRQHLQAGCWPGSCFPASMPVFRKGVCRGRTARGGIDDQQIHRLRRLRRLRIGCRNGIATC